VVVAKPEDFGGLKAGECGIAGDFAQSISADPVLDFSAFRRGALIIPEQSGTDDLAIGIEKDCTMHLSGKANAVNGTDGFGHKGLKSPAARRPPGLGFLFGPARFGG